MNKENLKNYVKDGKIIFDLNEENGLNKRDVFNLAHAFGLWLKEKMSRDETNISVAVGTDISDVCTEVRDVFLRSFTNAGFLVFDAQQTYLPAMFMMTIFQNVTGCVFIYSQSRDSGVICLEFLTRLGILSDDDLFEVIDMLTYSNKKIDIIVPDFRLDSNLKHFAETARQRICQRVNSTDYSRPLRSIKFVIDTNEGIGSYVVDKILLPLGAEVVEVKGTQLVAKHCRNVSANAGVIFDYSLQKMSIVSRKFGLLTKEATTYLLSQLIDVGENEEITVLTNCKVSSRCVSLANEKAKYKFVTHDKNADLIALQKNLNDNGVECPISIFEGGRCCFRDNYFLADPVYTLFKLIMKIISLKEEGKTLDDIVRPFYQSNQEWKIKIESFDKPGYAKTVMTAFEGHCLKDSRFDTFADETAIRCRADDLSFEVKNDDDAYISVKINCEDYRKTYKILYEIYAFLISFLSLNLDEIESVF